MDRLLFDLATSFLASAHWFEAAGQPLTSQRLIARAAELLDERSVCAPKRRVEFFDRC